VICASGTALPPGGAPVHFPRSRPFHKNDNCHVEQKNWTLVRRLIGYDRLDTPAQQARLDAFCTDLLRPFANCFQPVMKLIAKEPAEQRTRRVYDTPATPLRRLLDGTPSRSTSAGSALAPTSTAPPARSP